MTMHDVRSARSRLGAEYIAYLAELGVDHRQLIEHADASDLLAVAYRGRFLPAPVFISAAERAGLAADLRTVYDLLNELPDRLFGGEIEGLARAVGMNDVQTSIVRRAAALDAPRVPLARSDLYRDETGFKLLELNITSALGGFENAEINRTMLRHPALASFADRHGLGYVDSLVQIATSLRAECGPFLTGDRPVLALADWPESFLTYEPRLHVWARVLEEQGFEAIPCHVGQITERGGDLYVKDRRIDVIYRYFLVEEIFSDDDAALVEPLLRATEQGRVGMFSRLDAELYGNKGALALLSDERYRSTFSPRELDCVDRFLPWTRKVTPALESRALAEQHDLILKPTLLHGGNGIVPGWEVSAAEWETRVREAMNGPYVVQRRIRPAAEPFPDPDGAGVNDLYLNWGVFLTSPEICGGDGYGGCIVRGSLNPEVGIVSMSGGARVGCCFDAPETR
ncbi:hypothetical protein JOL79_16795 [Microbispora sp. RL4-1S]|uniref:Circularly permuted type 2 ATP-grasp protein n=1 Tax=Microbispora oryzae TaxID=2806554 RepID=A0A940WQY5_9ACTN|nr:hypothetical protein [Microbispora oryzae]MBP2705471.1 hypothetical protein [Microbispora oryzae]